MASGVQHMMMSSARDETIGWQHLERVCQIKSDVKVYSKDHLSCVLCYLFVTVVAASFFFRLKTIAMYVSHSSVPNTFSEKGRDIQILDQFDYHKENVELRGINAQKKLGKPYKKEMFLA